MPRSSTASRRPSRPTAAPANAPAARHTARYVSCMTSATICSSAHRRRSRTAIHGDVRRYSSSNAARSPLATSRTRRSSSNSCSAALTDLTPARRPARAAGFPLDVIPVTPSGGAPRWALLPQGFSHAAGSAASRCTGSGSASPAMSAMVTPSRILRTLARRAIHSGSSGCAEPVYSRPVGPLAAHRHDRPVDRADDVRDRDGRGLRGRAGNRRPRRACCRRSRRASDRRESPPGTCAECPGPRRWPRPSPAPRPAARQAPAPPVPRSPPVQRSSYDNCAAWRA